MTSQRFSFVLAALFLAFGSVAQAATPEETRRLKLVGPEKIDADALMVVIAAEKPKHIAVLTTNESWLTEMQDYVAYHPADEIVDYRKIVIRKTSEAVDSNGNPIPGRLKIWKFDANVWNRTNPPRNADWIDFDTELGPLLRMIKKEGDGYVIVPWWGQNNNGSRWIMKQAEDALASARDVMSKEELDIAEILTGKDDNGKPRTQVYDWFEINPYDFDIASHDMFSINLGDFKFDTPRVVTREFHNGPLNSYIALTYSITNPDTKPRVIRPRFRMIKSTMYERVPGTEIDAITYLNSARDDISVSPEIGGIIPLSSFDFASLDQTELDNLISFSNLIPLEASLEKMSYLRSLQVRLGAFDALKRNREKDNPAPARLEGEPMGVPGFVFAPGQTKYGLAVFEFNPDIYRFRIVVEGLNNSYYHDNYLLDEHFKELATAVSDYERYAGSANNVRHIQKVLSLRFKRVANSTRYEPDGVGARAKSWEWIWDWPSALKPTEIPSFKSIDLLTRDYDEDTKDWEKKYVCLLKWRLKNETTEAQAFRVNNVSLAVPLTLNIKESNVTVKNEAGDEQDETIFAGVKSTDVRLLVKIVDNGYSSLYKDAFCDEMGIENRTDRYQFIGAEGHPRFWREREVRFPRRWRDSIIIQPMNRVLERGQINQLDGISIFDLDDIDINDIAQQIETYLSMSGALQATDEAATSPIVRLTDLERRTLREMTLKALLGDGNTAGELNKMFSDPNSVNLGSVSKNETVADFMGRWNQARIQLIVDADVGVAEPPADDPTLCAIASGRQQVMWYNIPLKDVMKTVVEQFGQTENVPTDLYKMFEVTDQGIRNEEPAPLDIRSPIPYNWPDENHPIRRSFNPLD